MLAASTKSLMMGGAGGGFGTVAAFAGKMKHAVKKVEQAAIVVSRARALEHVEHNHPRVPGSLHTVKVMESIYKRDEEQGKLVKVR
jgi:hypothetical protein